MKRTTISLLTMALFGLLISLSCPAATSFSDDFEDGSIDANLWVIGGGKRGPSPSTPMGVGDWSYSHDEVMGGDGHLDMRVWGPTSGNTYGAEAWVRTVYDFNDGNFHMINFTWEADVAITDHYDLHYIQITDGYIPDPGYLHWPQQEMPGTKDLLWHTDSGQESRGWTLTSGLQKTSWSIQIGSDGVARLYDAPDATGSLIREETLDDSYSWYVRFMVIDGTSSGFPAGDDHLKLYHFSAVPEPAALSLLALGALLVVLKKRTK